MTSSPCPECGTPNPAPFTGESMTIEHKGRAVTIADLAGWRCLACGETVFDADSAHRYAAGSDALVMAARQEERQDIRRIRRKLGLTQAMAARLTGGGHNAFSRYERGEAVPMPAVVNLFKLLDKHPELLKEIL